MTGALAETAHATQAHSAHSTPFALENGVNTWLQLPNAVTFPEDLPPETPGRLRELFDIAEGDDSVTPEDLLRKVGTAIGDLDDERARIESRFFVAGFDRKTLQLVAPSYRCSVEALGQAIRGRLGTVAISAATVVVEPPVERTVIEPEPIAQTVEAVIEPEPVVEDVADELVELPLVVEPEDDSADEPELPVVEIADDDENDMELDADAGIPEVYEVLPERARVVKPESAETKANRDKLNDLLASTVIESVRPRSDLAQTLQLATDLFGLAIEPELASQFRTFIERYGFEIYRTERQESRKPQDVTELNLQTIRHFMQGVDPADIKTLIGDTSSTHHSMIIRGFVRALHGNMSAHSLKLTFAEFVAEGASPMMEQSLAILAHHKVGAVALVETIEPPSIEPGPTPLLLVENPDLEWFERALCAQTDPEAFFPEKGGSTREAKKICTGCEVRAECLSYALQHEERFGIWGGLSERERRRMKRGSLTTRVEQSEEDMSSIAFQSPEVRVRHLVDILSNPSDTENDMVEAVLRDDRELLGRYVDTVIGWFETERPKRLTRADRSLIHRYFTGNQVADATTSLYNRTRLTRRVDELQDLIDESDIEDPLRHFLNESLGFHGNPTVNPQRIEDIA